MTKHKSKPQREALGIIYSALPGKAFLTWRENGVRNFRVEVNGVTAEALVNRGMATITSEGAGIESVALTERGIAVLHADGKSVQQCNQAVLYSQQDDAEEALITTQARRRRAGTRIPEKSIRWCAQHRGWHLSAKPPKDGTLVSNRPTQVLASQ
nr:hypothetical protein [Rhodococcus sp. (in: high G+C Gram-positive bacteria)]